MSYYKMLKEAKKKKLDPVDQDELKGDHEDREDGDIDNDGDEDSSDEYLHKRRQAVSKAIAKKKMKEEVELEEASKPAARALAKADKTAKPKSEVSLKKAPWEMKKEAKDYGPGHIGAVQKMLDKEREAKKAKDAMKKEEVEELEELSKDTLGRYAKKAHDRGDMAARMSNHGRNKDMADIANKRYFGVQKAISKLSGRARVNATEEANIEEAAPKIKPDFVKVQREKDRAHDAAMGRTATGRKKPERAMTSTQKSMASMRKEEVEQIDELSKKTLGSYIKKASASAVGIGSGIGADAAKNRKAHPDDTRQLRNRMKGVQRATDRLTKEEATPEFDLVAELAKLITKDAKY